MNSKSWQYQCPFRDCQPQKIKDEFTFDQDVILILLQVYSLQLPGSVASSLSFQCSIIIDRFVFACVLVSSPHSSPHRTSGTSFEISLGDLEYRLYRARLISWHHILGFVLAVTCLNHRYHTPLCMLYCPRSLRFCSTTARRPFVPYLFPSLMMFPWSFLQTSLLNSPFHMWSALTPQPGAPLYGPNPQRREHNLLEPPLLSSKIQFL
jgi:hypothetical protein